MPRKYSIPRRKPALVEGVLVIKAEFLVSSSRNAVHLFWRQYGVYPLKVNGRMFVGHCSKTGAVILEGDKFFLPDSHGDYPLLQKVVSDSRWRRDCQAAKRKTLKCG